LARVTSRRRLLARTGDALALGLSVALASPHRGPAAAADDLPPASREHRVADASELRAALGLARPGDHIVLADGVYAPDGDLRVTAAGTARAPVVLRAAQPLGARLGTAVAVEAAAVVLAGLRFDGAGLRLAGDHARVVGCRFEGTSKVALSISAGQGQVVERCEFVGCTGRGVSIGPRGRAGAIVGPRIARNLFRDFAGTPGDNGHEAVQIGQYGDDALLDLGAVVEHNLFLGVGVDSETISVKSSGNTVRHNTFQGCRSRPTNRFGNRNHWHANWIEDCRGLWVYGAGHELLGNRLVGANGDGLCLMAGNTAPEDIRKAAPAAGGRPKDHAPHCLDVVAAGNEAGRLVVGKVIERFGRAYDLPARGTRVERHAGPLARELEVGTILAAETSRAIPIATKLTARDIGPESVWGRRLAIR
jgi:Chondroitinase B